jgi:hypothetical protein
MAQEVVINPGGGNAKRVVSFDAMLTALFLDVKAAGPITASFSTTAGSATPQSKPMDEIRLKTGLTNGYALVGATFQLGPDRYVARGNGFVDRNPSPTTGIGSRVGTISTMGGDVTLTNWAAGSAGVATAWRALAAPPINGLFTPFNTYGTTFRIATAPIRPGSFSVLGTMQDGTTFAYAADSDGFIDEALIKGRINYQTGVVTLLGVSPTAPPGVVDKVDVSFLGVTGVTSEYLAMIRQETLRYSAVAFTYLPLNADLLGIDPVRLPSDGRVPIFRPGGLAVVGHKQTTTPAVMSNGQTVNCGRVRLSRVRVLGANNAVIPDTSYTEDLEAGTVTFTDVTGYSQPVRVEHRIEDMGLVRDVQLDGSITFTRALTHNYPIGSYVSSCLRSGDLKSRVSLVFDQASWDNVSFADVITGSAAPGTYNAASFPILVTNAGAVTERWALRFTSTTTVDVIGEHVGNLGNYSINALIAPVNAITGKPYFSIPVLGWGAGWSVGNVVRLNTVGAMFPVWLIRTVQQGPEAAADYQFLTIVRGDVDNPLV